MSRRASIAWTAGAALLVLVTAVVLAARSSADASKEIATHVVVAGPFERQVTAEGYFEAENTTPIVAPTEAQEPMKIAWLADDQSLVKKGDMLVQFDPTDFTKNLVAGTNDRQKSDNKVVKLDAEAIATRRNLERDVTQAEAELTSAQSFAPKDPEIFSRYQVVESAIEEELAIERRAYARRVQAIRAQLASTDRDLQMIEQRKADLKISQAKQGLDALIISAPHDGLIVFKRDWRGEIPRVGSTMWPGSPIGEIPRMERMRAQLFVLEADAGGIEVGQNAIVRPDAFSSKSFPATVEQIDKIAKPRLRGVPVQYFGVRLKIASTDLSVMKPGSRLRATIDLARSERAITIPRQALFDKGGAKIVYVRSGQRFVARPVTVAVITPGKVMIQSGLVAGDVIAMKDPTAEEGETRAKAGA